ncbi:MAG: RloB domain-containing protein [Eggerthellaceae bacterium]|nr:RloB domain-containing protein [Eggerthellaceae bacterium]
MSPLLPLDTWSARATRPEVSPKSKCFLVGEGANTEYWYLESLAERLAKMDLPELIELKPVKRTGDDRNQSAPRSLLEQARRIRADEDGDFGFDEATDRIVAFFDIDAYKGDAALYESDLESFRDIAQVAVTNPSFELFLLLHLDGAINRIVLPNEQEILLNSYVGRRRFVEKLARDELGINVKRNRTVGKLADRFEIAARAETALNQNPAKAMGRLTSNVAASINTVIQEGSAL